MTSQESGAGGRRHGGRASGAATGDAADHGRSDLKMPGKTAADALSQTAQRSIERTQVGSKKRFAKQFVETCGRNLLRITLSMEIL